MPVDKGTYSSSATYARLDMVHTADSTYVSKVDNNVGHPVTDTNYWQCYADGKQATEAAAAANTAAALANEKAGDAEAAATLANEKAALVQEKLDRADTDHTRAESDHTTAASDHTTAQSDHTQAGADHTQAESDHSTATADHTTAASDHTTAETDHTTAASDHVRAEDDHTRAETDHTAIADKVSQAELEEALSNKADISGYYSGMTVGSAENLVGRGSVAAEYQGIRTSAGSEDIGVGAAQIREVMGRSIVWNQLKQLRWLVQTDSSVVGSLSYDSTTGIVTLTPLAGRSYIYVYMPGPIAGKEGHKIMGAVYNTPDTQQQVIYRECKGAARDPSTYPIATVTSSGINTPIITFTRSDGSKFTADPIKIKIMLFDLTQLFGEGNEPTTVEEFERMFPLPYYEYNEGTIINNEATGIKTAGFNLFNPATGKAVLPGKYSDYAYEYEICGTFTSISFEDYAGNVTTPELHDGRFFNVDAPGVLTVIGGNATDTLVHLVWSGWRNYGEPDYAYEAYWENTLQLNLKTLTGKLNGQGESVVIFPEGMRSAGAAYDSLIVDSDGYARKAVKRIGSVDMGMLGWVPDEPNERFYSATLANLIRRPTTWSGAWILTTKFDSANNVSADKTISVYSNGRIYVKDTSYASTTALATALSGVPLYYELATYEEYTLDTPIFLGYPVDDFGTEAKLPVDTAALPTGPIRYRVTYPMNAVDPIRRLPTNYISKESMENMLTAMKTAGIIGDYTMTYNSTSGAYTFTVTAPSSEPSETTDLNA